MNRPTDPTLATGRVAPGTSVPLLTAAGVLAIFLALTWWAWTGANHLAAQRAQENLADEAHATVRRIEGRMALYEQILFGVRALFAATEDVSRERFRRYVAEMEIDRRLPGIQGIGFAKAVPASEKSAHIASIRAAGFPEYSIRPDGERELYAPIVYMEPFARDNLKVFGFDPYSAELPRRAMERARDDNAIISAKLRLQQDEGRGDAPGFVMYLPVYRTGTAPDDAPGRRGEILGWIDAPFNVRALLAGIELERTQRIAYRIYDGSEISPRTLLYASHGAIEAEPAGALQVERQLRVAGREWTLVASPESASGAGGSVEYELPSLVLRMGIVFSALMAWLAWLLVRSRQQALAMVGDTTLSLLESDSRLRALIDNAAACIITVDQDGRIESINIAALRVFGYTRDELVGRNIRMLVPGSHRQLHDQYIRDYLVTGESRIIGAGREVIGERKGGQSFPMELVVTEMAIGERRAFTAIIRDISQRKQAETALLARSSALARANADLSRFAEVAAHHLVEPIRRIASFAQRLRGRLRDLGGSDRDDEVALALTTLEANATRLRSLVRDIERYVAAGLFQEDRVPMCDATRTVQPLQERTVGRFMAIGGRLEVMPLPVARIGAGQLATVFDVLLDNTLVHGRPLDPGAALQVSIDGERLDGVSRYRVRDNGPGIPEAYRERVFGIFERLGSAGGNGIGLALARRIIEAQGGRIWVEGAASGGTIVIFEVPDAGSG